MCGGEEMSTSATIDEIRSWPIERRLEVVFQLWEEILDSGWQPELTEQLRAELGSRWAAYQANPQDVRPWAQIEARLRRSP